MVRSRREVLRGLATAGTATLLAGCSGLGNETPGDGTSGETSGRGPVETVRQFNTAIRKGNIDRANSLIHPDSSIEAEGVDKLSDPTLSLVSKSETESTVDVTTDSISVHIILRKHDGEWMVYDSE